MIHGMRRFHFHYHEAVENIGCDPSDMLPILDKARFYALTENDHTHLGVLEDMLEEFYGITSEGWEEWR